MLSQLFPFLELQQASRSPNTFRGNRTEVSTADRLRLSFAGIAAALGVLVFSSSRLMADDWMFRRSYYSHQIPEELREQYPTPRLRSAYRPAIIGDGFGVSYRGGIRFNRTFIQSGNSGDYQLNYESWINVRD